MAPGSTLSLLLVITLVLTDLSTLVVATDYSAQAYLDPHNAARADVGVAPLVWSTTLESYALTYSLSQTSQCTSLKPSGGPYGENLYYGYGNAYWTSPQAAVDLWVSEKIYYDEPNNTCSAPEGKTCSHYTQVVWSSTTALGCAWLPCDDGTTAFIMCSYYPAGNWKGGRPY